MARAKLTRDEKKARTREALLAAAADAFAVQGFHKTSLEQVAETAGFTIGAVYSNFAGKEELFLAVMDQWGVEEAMALAGEMMGVQTPEAGVEAIERWFNTRWSDPARLLAMFEFVLHTRSRPEAVEALRLRALSVQAGLDMVIQGVRGQMSVAPGIDSEQASRAILAIAYGIAVQRILEPEAPVAELVSHLLRKVLLDSPTP